MMHLDNKQKWLKAEWSLDTVMAIVTVLLTWASFYVMYHTQSMIIKGLVFAIFTNIGVNVVFPCYWCLIRKKETLAELGITKKNLFMGLIIGLALAYIKVYQLFPMLDGVDWIAHLLYNLFLFWEPFFIFGWLQSRFEKSFGIVGGILLAGLSLGIYHIGSFDPLNVLILTVNGIVFASVYRLTKNLISMWPAFWCVSAAVGTLSGNMIFGMEIAIVYLIVFLLQIGFIIFAYRYAKRKRTKTDGSFKNCRLFLCEKISSRIDFSMIPQGENCVFLWEQPANLVGSAVTARHDHTKQ